MFVSYKNFKYFLVLCVISILFQSTKSYASSIESFLYLPFSYKHYRTFQVGEARRYSGVSGYMNLIGSGEYFMHGLKQHSAIDYSLPYGADVLAPTEGYIIASYHNAFLKEKGYFRLYQGVKMHYGLGWYVQIWNPKNNVFVVLGHLSSIDSLIPVSAPIPTPGKNGAVNRRDPTGVTSNTDIIQQMIDDTKVHPILGYVKRGQRIGTVGVSGLEWDDNMITSAPVPREPEYPQTLSWDEPHIHFEVFTVVDGKKQLIDPYNMYRDFIGYPDSNTIRTRLGKTLFQQTEKGRIRFADEK